MADEENGKISSLAAGRPPSGDAEGQAMLNRITANLFEVESAPVTVGRFEVIDSIGAGGMGVVYRARDPKLGRLVALKLLHPEMLGHEGERSRLLREAQSLAQLSHPNVVQVHEVGETEGKPFIAMELVEGQSLNRWVAQEPRPGWRERVQVYLQAGTGLAAAHAEGLVHRDFKPDNAIIDNKGQVRVLDFGLARQTTDATVDLAPEDTTAVVLLTRTGKVLGTPAYMPLEQLEGRSADARSDQFSFCVALYEALYGHRPFQGRTVAALKASVVAGQVRPPPKSMTAPVKVRQVLERGLAIESEDRWPSMDALLFELRQLVAPRTKRWWVVAVAAVGLGLLVGGVGFTRMVALREEERQERCPRVQLDEAWGEERRQAVERSILGAGVSYAPGIWDRVAPILDDYAGEWTEQHADACHATSVRKDQSTEIMDLRMRCLQRMKREFAAATELLAAADETVVRNARRVVDDLRPLSHCGDLEMLQSEVEPPASADEALVDNARGHLATARAERSAGRFSAAQNSMEEAKGLLVDVEYEPVRVEAALEQGAVFSDLGRYEASESALKEALVLASRRRQWREMQQAAAGLMAVIGERQQRVSEGLQYRELAVALAGRDDLARAVSLHNLAVVLTAGGRYDEAEAEVRRVLAIRDEELGPEHAASIASRQALSTILLRKGQYEEAKVEIRRVLPLAEESLGPKHPSILAIRNGLVNILCVQGDFEEATTEIRQIVSLAEQSLGAEHELVAMFRGNLGNALAAQGALAEAEMEQRRALALRKKVLRPGHALIAESYNNLGDVLARRNKLEEAEVEHQKALVLREKELGPNHPLTATSQYNIASVLLEQDRAEDAVTFAERAWAHYQDYESPTDRAETAFLLVRALWSDPEQHARARNLARRARDLYIESGVGKNQIEEIDAWLLEHDHES